MGCDWPTHKMGANANGHCMLSGCQGHVILSLWCSAAFMTAEWPPALALPCQPSLGMQQLCTLWGSSATAQSCNTDSKKLYEKMNSHSSQSCLLIPKAVSFQQIQRGSNKVMKVQEPFGFFLVQACVWQNSRKFALPKEVGPGEEQEILPDSPQNWALLAH